MHIATDVDAEIRETIEVAVALANAVDDDVDLRAELGSSGFGRAPSASAASLRRLHDRLVELAPLVRSLPDLTTGEALQLVNEQLTELPIEPSIADHDGVGPHMHWTAATTRFDDQVMADIVMAIAQELCSNGTQRFGRCGASDCDDLFYDATRNHSKRFCADPRCASRTHTADHRARQRAERPDPTERTHG